MRCIWRQASIRSITLHRARSPVKTGETTVARTLDILLFELKESWTALFLDDRVFHRIPICVCHASANPLLRKCIILRCEFPIGNG